MLLTINVFDSFDDALLVKAKRQILKNTYCYENVETNERCIETKIVSVFKRI